MIIGEADLVLLNGRIFTMNPEAPDAEAVAIDGNRISKVGTNEDVKQLIGERTRVIDLRGKGLVPGLIDAHIHLAGYGLSLARLDLRDIQSITELKQLLGRRAQEVPEENWILGRGWDQDRFSEKRYPTKEDLDEAAPNNPVMLTRVCGHACVVNSRALELASITRETQDPSGGHIDRDPRTGEPTGLLLDAAESLVWEKIPRPTEEELRKAISAACREAVKRGLTSIHLMSSGSFRSELRAFRWLLDHGKLPLRVYAMVPASLAEELKKLGILTGFGNSFLKIGGVKMFADGSLGARTAALREPYDDDPTNSGILMHDQDELNAMVSKAHSAGLQVAIHAIGDRAVEAALDAIEAALREHPRRDHRHRIEHASVLSEELIERIKELNVLAVCQPHFVVSDFWVPERVGRQRARWVYPFKTLMREGIVVAGGSDCPVEPLDPLKGIWAAMVRPGSNPEETITAEEALQMYTVNSAYASFDEGVVGSIEEGKLADLVVLSRDPLSIGAEDMRDLQVEMTIVGGKAVYSSMRLA